MQDIPILGDGLPSSLLDMLPEHYRVISFDEASRESPADDIRQIQGIVCYGHPTVDGPLLDRLPLVKVVSNHGVGVDHIDVAAARGRNVAVGNTPGCLDASTADMTMALILSIARNVVVGDTYARSPEFLHYDPSILIGQEVTGSTLGIIGMGRIGEKVAQRAAGFDMRVIYHNRNRKPECEQRLGVTYVERDELLSTSDFVSLNCPLTPETTGLIGARAFAQMQRSAILINMARGPVVDSAALYDALQSGTITAAAIDVTEPEPLPRDDPLLGLPNLIITPHLGSASNRTRQRMMEMTVDNLNAGIAGGPLPFPVGS
jgi:glyoxylate reductase